MRKTHFYAALVGLVLSGAALASVTVTCEVEQKVGFSFGSTVTRQVQFATGSELNTATRSFEFGSFDNYALLWFSQSEVAILKHTGVAIGITGDSGVDDLDHLFGFSGQAQFKQVNGGSDTEYRITCKRFGRWVDDRLN